MKKNNKSMDEIRDIVARLEAVVNELKEIGCYGSIVMGHTDEDSSIELLMNNENLPEGKASYKKSAAGSYYGIEKLVPVGNVIFTTYITKKEAQKELFGE